MANQPVYNAGFLEAPETPKVGVEPAVVVKELLVPGYTL